MTFSHTVWAEQGRLSVSVHFSTKSELTPILRMDDEVGKAGTTTRVNRAMSEDYHQQNGR